MKKRKELLLLISIAMVIGIFLCVFGCTAQIQLGWGNNIDKKLGTAQDIGTGNVNEIDANLGYEAEGNSN
jgi:hypothetical protein